MAIVIPHPWLAEFGPHLFEQVFPKMVTDEELARFLHAVEAHVSAQQEPFAWVVMADALMSSSAKQRAEFAAAERRMKDKDQALCVGTAFVLTSAIARGAVTAVYWLSPPVYPYKVCATREAALAWASGRLEGERSA